MGGGSGVTVIVLVYPSYGSDRISTMRVKRGTDWPLDHKAPKVLAGLGRLGRAWGEACGALLCSTVSCYPGYPGSAADAPAYGDILA